MRLPNYTAYAVFSLPPGVSDTLARTQGTHVKDDQSSLAGGVNRFQSTRWSVVLLSAQSQTPGCKEALADLYKLYWYPLYAFIRHRGYSPEDAQDLVQGVFLHLIEYKTLSRVDRSKGKFRSFLLAALHNYLASETDRARCLKRGGKTEFVHIYLEEAEDRYGLEPVEELTPEKIFDARWAMALLGEAMNRLSREYMAQGKATTFRALKTFLDPINAKKLPSYEQAAAQLEVSVGSLKTQIHRLRKQHSAIVREEISRTVSDSADVEMETHELCQALIAAEGWVIP
jgi:RNA polymerase sigma-70 factor (ECF subfamily)